MSWFSGKGRIDPATGRNKRDKGPQRETHGGPRRDGGRIKPKARLEHQRDRETRRK